MSDEKWNEINRELIDSVIDYMNEKVDSSDPDFFQLMDDVVIPVLESCLAADIIDDKHLDQHVKELKVREERSEEVLQNVDEIECAVREMKHLLGDII